MEEIMKENKTKEQKLREYATLMAKNQRIFLKKIDQYRDIALIMIVSDQEDPKTLARCLDSITEWVDEIDIIFNYKHFKNPFKLNKLIKTVRENQHNADFNYEYKKFTDFSDMRNRSLALADTEYIIWLDADDYMVHPAGMRDLILKLPHVDVFKCRINSFTEQNTIETIFHNRIMRRVKNGKTPYWLNRCHEDASYSMDELGYIHSMTDMIINHYGYVDPEAWYRKNQRNLKLMKADRNEIIAKGIDAPKQDMGRISMIEYGMVNALIIVAGREKDDNEKLDTLVEALEICDACIARLEDKDPLKGKMWMLRGVVCSDAGNIAAAKQSYLKAYDEWKQPEAAVNLSHLLLQEGDWNKTIEILEEVYNTYQGVYPIQNVSYDPQSLHYMLVEKLGHAYANKSQDQKENPDNFDKYMRKAEFYYLQAITMRPKLPILNTLIQILFKTGRANEGALMTMRAINMFPEYDRGWQIMGEYELMNNRKVTASVFLKEALRRNPKLKEAMHNKRMLEKK